MQKQLLHIQILVILLECYLVLDQNVQYLQLLKMKQHTDNFGACWNISPRLFSHQDSIDSLVYLGIDSLKKEGILNVGDKVIIAGGAKAAANLSDNEARTNRVMGGIVEI